MATIGEQLLAPETGWKRYNDNSPLINSPGFSDQADASSYLGSYKYNSSSSAKLTFRFKGSKLRIIARRYPTSYTAIAELVIDGVVVNEFSLTGTDQRQTLVAEKEGLNDTFHLVEVRVKGGQTGGLNFDAIDIDSTGRILHLDEVTNLSSLVVGKRIRCHYKATANAVGTFSGLGQETSDFIPPESTATPNGDFYFIMVEDWNGKLRLIADRNIQHSISWDTLNAAGMVSNDYTSFLGFNSESLLLATLNKDLSVQVTGTTSGAYRFSKSYQQPKKSGKWYFETSIDNFVGNLGVGVCRQDSPTAISTTILNATTHRLVLVNQSGNVITYGDGKLYNQANGVVQNGSIISVFLDMDNGNLSFKVDGVEYNPPINDILSLGEVVPMVVFLTTTAGGKTTTNFGATPFKYQIPEGYKPYDEIHNDYAITTRLLTGGTSAADKDNEWDKYIVGSTLNGTIIAGDSEVWNSTTSSWTSTTNTSASANRTVRTKTSSSYGATGTINANGGFRPVLEIEALFSYKMFVFEKGTYKKWTNMWATVSTSLPNEEGFKQYGMSDLLSLNRKLQSVQQSSMSVTSSPDGQVFRSSISLARYKDVRKISIT